MIYKIFCMTKSTMRLLYRNKGFLFIAVLLPLLGTLILNLTTKHVKDEVHEDYTVLEGANVQMAYLEKAGKMQIKAYDMTQAKESKILFKQLAASGLFQVFVVESKDMTDKEVMTSAEKTALHDKVDAILIIKKGFDRQMQEGQLTDSVCLYQVGEDERYKLLEERMETVLYGMMLGKQSDTQVDTSIKNTELRTEVLESTEDDSYYELACDPQRISIFGNTLGIYTVAFLLAGVLILSTIMTERDNLVFTRIMLSRASSMEYIISKFVIVLLCSILQTTVAALSYILFVRADVGLTPFEFAFILFQLALIFNFASVGIGICCKNVLSASLVCFSIWVLSGVLAGVYFNLSNASIAYKKIAMLFPQRWGMQGASMFVAGKTNAYPMLILVTVTYLIVVLLIGQIGLKLAKKD